jgi:hypothetical protein
LVGARDDDEYINKDQKEEMAREGGNNHVENREGILYNDTIDQLKGM